MKTNKYRVFVALLLASWLIISCGGKRSVDGAITEDKLDNTSASGISVNIDNGNYINWDLFDVSIEDEVGDHPEGASDIGIIKTVADQKNLYLIIGFHQRGSNDVFSIFFDVDGGEPDYFLSLDSDGNVGTLFSVTTEPQWVETAIDWIDISTSLGEYLELRIPFANFAGQNVQSLFGNLWILEEGEEGHLGDEFPSVSPQYFDFIESNQSILAENQIEESIDNLESISDPVQIPKGTTVFNDNFNDMSASHLLLDDLTSQINISTLESGEHVLNLPPAILLLGSQDLTNFSISTRVLFLDYGGSLGLQFGNEINGEFFEMIVLPGDGDNIFSVNNSSSVFIELMMWYSVEFVVFEGTGIVLVEGEQVLATALTVTKPLSIYLTNLGDTTVQLNEITVSDLTDPSPYDQNAKSVEIDGLSAEWQDIIPIYERDMQIPLDVSNAINEIRAMIFEDDLFINIMVDHIDVPFSIEVTLFYENGKVQQNLGFRPQEYADGFTTGDGFENAVGDVVEIKIPLWQISADLPDSYQFWISSSEEDNMTPGIHIFPSTDLYMSHHEEFKLSSHNGIAPINIAEIVKNLNIDGYGEDWNLIPTSYIDSVGDNAPGSIDYGEVKAFCYEEKFFFMLDFFANGKADIYSMYLSSSFGDPTYWLDFVPRSGAFARREGSLFYSLFRKSEFAGEDVVEFWVELNEIGDICPERLLLTSQHNNNEYADDILVDFSIPKY